MSAVVKVCVGADGNISTHYTVCLTSCCVDDEEEGHWTRVWTGADEEEGHWTRVWTG